MSLNIKTFEEYRNQYNESISNPEQFWDNIAKTFLWKRPWNKTLEWNFNEPKIEWFINGKLNITENCLDRHLTTFENKTAIIWESNNPNEKSIKLTYQELHQKVCQFANVLKNNDPYKKD